MAHRPDKPRNQVVRHSDFRVVAGTVGGELAGGGRNGLPERSDYVWRGGDVEPDPHQLALIARAGLAGRQRRALAVMLQRHAPEAAGELLKAADGYAAAAAYAALAYPDLAAASILAAAENDWRPCHCLCPVAHPDATGICEPLNATATRRIGRRDVQVCQACADAYREA